jgi:hypothetical protein
LVTAYDFSRRDGIPRGAVLHPKVCREETPRREQKAALLDKYATEFAALSLQDYAQEFGWNPDAQEAQQLQPLFHQEVQKRVGMYRKAAEILRSGVPINPESFKQALLSTWWENQQIDQQATRQIWGP